MKSIKTISSLFLAAFVALTTLSCSGDDSGGSTGGVAAAGTIEAKVGGSNFKSMTIATTALKVSVGGATSITIQGSDSSGKTIQLILNGVDATTGSYDIGVDTNISAVGTYTEINTSTFASTTWAAPYEGGGVVGEITITEITDTNIKGTFNFTGRNQENASDTKAVTNGAFNVAFSEF